MEQRTAHRFPTDLEAECRSCSRRWTSRLSNISTTGCMIMCPEPSLPESALLRLRLRGLTAIDTQIVWQNRGHVGIRFKVPLHKAVMEHLGFRELALELEPESLPTVAQSQPLDGPGGSLSGHHQQLVERAWQDEPAIRIAAAR